MNKILSEEPYAVIPHVRFCEGFAPAMGRIYSITAFFDFSKVSPPQICHFSETQSLISSFVFASDAAFSQFFLKIDFGFLKNANWIGF